MFRASSLLSIPEGVFVTELEEAEEVVASFLAHADRGGLEIGVDSETTGLNLKEDRISVFSIYAPVAHSLSFLPSSHSQDISFVFPGGTIGCQAFLDCVSPLLARKDVIKAGANLSGFDFFMFRNHGAEIAEPIHDTLAMSWAFDENRNSHGLKQSMRDFFGFLMQDYKTAGRGELDVRKWDLPSVIAYASQDAWASYKVYEFLKQALVRDRLYGDTTAWDIYLDLIYPVMGILRAMMDRGIRVDMQHLDELAPRIRNELLDIQTWFQGVWTQYIHQTGRAYLSKAKDKDNLDRVSRGKAPKHAPDLFINLSSTFHLQHLFFALLGAPVLAKNPPSKDTGEQSPSLKKEILEEYAEGEYGLASEVAEKLMTFRQLDKLYGTYIGDVSEDDAEELHGRADAKGKGGLRNKVSKRTGRVYTTFKLGPVTGRLASSSPNLMNIPTRTKLGKEIRRAFIAAPGHSLIVADFSTLEMNLFAHFSERGIPEQQQVMCRAIRDNLDIHCWSASLILRSIGRDVPYERIKLAKSKDEQGTATSEDKELLSWRTIGKTIGFGVIYGMGPHKLSGKLSISHEEADRMIQAYFHAFPHARRWIDQVIESVTRTHKVFTLFGRPRRIREIASPERWIVARAKRRAVNTIIQGSAADVVLGAMRRCSDDPLLRDLQCKLLLQVHDELLFEIPTPNIEVALPRVVDLMQYTRERDGLEVDLLVSAHHASNWRDAK